MGKKIVVSVFVLTITLFLLVTYLYVRHEVNTLIKLKVESRYSGMNIELNDPLWLGLYLKRAMRINEKGLYFKNQFTSESHFYPKEIIVVLTDKLRVGYKIEEQGQLLAGSVLDKLNEDKAVLYIWLDERELEYELEHDGANRLLTRVFLDSVHYYSESDVISVKISNQLTVPDKFLNLILYFRKGLIHVYRG